MSLTQMHNRTGIESLVDGLADVWAETMGDERVSVAILDGSVDLSHAAFRGARLREVKTLASGLPRRGSAARHGTHVASVIFGSHEGPVKGIAPRCSGLLLPIFGDVVGESPVPCSQIDLARAVNQAVLAGADVINI